MNIYSFHLLFTRVRSSQRASSRQFFGTPTPQTFGRYW
ncbi:hypothetical protein CSUI_011166 [Cystoisospora suis]|uniref:Uncharacterized protein n=1 Tax=Cystoisospora suis TaxID=483139 RepID=A0A2C6KF21_9APIC|nr:hypothetical protein CSUI_011166 [Cystoisospora suis]